MANVQDIRALQAADLIAEGLVNLAKVGSAAEVDYPSRRQEAAQIAFRRLREGIEQALIYLKER